MGRKLRFGESTKILTLRVPESKYDEFKKMALEYLELYLPHNVKYNFFRNQMIHSLATYSHKNISEEKLQQRKEWFSQNYTDEELLEHYKQNKQSEKKFKREQRLKKKGKLKVSYFETPEYREKQYITNKCALFDKIWRYHSIDWNHEYIASSYPDFTKKIYIKYLKEIIDHLISVITKTQNTSNAIPKPKLLNIKNKLREMNSEIVHGCNRVNFLKKKKYTLMKEFNWRILNKLPKEIQDQVLLITKKMIDYFNQQLTSVGISMLIEISG